MMKIKEMRNLSREDMKKKIGELEEELFNLRFQAKMGQLANPLQLRMVRRTLARVKTVLGEKGAPEQAKK